MAHDNDPLRVGLGVGATFFPFRGVGFATVCRIVSCAVPALRTGAPGNMDGVDGAGGSCHGDPGGFDLGAEMACTARLRSFCDNLVPNELDGVRPALADWMPSEMLETRDDDA